MPANLDRPLAEPLVTAENLEALIALASAGTGVNNLIAYRLLRVVKRMDAIQRQHAELVAEVDRLHPLEPSRRPDLTLVADQARGGDDA